MHPRGESGTARAAEDGWIDGVYGVGGWLELGRRRSPLYRFEARCGRLDPERLRANNPLQIVLAPGDLAGAYVFLSSRTNARGITGTILTVDAGATLRMPRRS